MQKPLLLDRIHDDQHLRKVQIEHGFDQLDYPKE
jgi:hypothetical protein